MVNDVYCQEYSRPGNNSVLVYAPGYSAPGDEQNQICDNSKKTYFKFAKHFHAIPSPLTCYENEAASVDLVKEHFRDYGTIIMQSHGWFWDSETGVGPYPGFRTGTIAFDLGDSELPQKNNKYVHDLLFFRLAISKKFNNAGDYHFVVLPNFVDYYLDDMPNTFMYLGFCHSMQNDGMWKAFERKGAKVFFGWDEEMYREDNEIFFDQLMQRMLPSNESIVPFTAANAFADIDNSVKERETEDGRPSFAVLETTSPEWNNFIFKDKNYLTISASGNIIVWDMDNNIIVNDVERNDGSIASFPVSQLSVSNWLKSRTEITSSQLYWIRDHFGQGGNHDGFSSSCFADGYDSRDCYDMVSFSGSGGCNQVINGIPPSSLSFQYNLSSAYLQLGTCNTYAERNSLIPLWNGEADTNYSLDGYGSLVLIAPPSDNIGIAVSGSKKIHANNLNVEDMYLQVGRDQKVTETSRVTYGYLWEGMGGNYTLNTDVVDAITIQDPWGLEYSRSFSSHIHRSAETSRGPNYGFGNFDYSNSYLSYNYMLSGIFNDTKLVHVRVIRIKEKHESCNATNSIVFDEPNWKFCTPKDDYSQTPIFDVMASVITFGNIADTNPFLLQRNTYLEHILSQMITDNTYQIKLKFIR